MRKRQLGIVISILFLMTGAFALNRRASLNVGSPHPTAQIQNPAPSGNPHPATFQQSQGPATAHPATPQEDAGIPEHVIYGLLFREVEAFKRKADDLERHGQDGTPLRSYHKNKAGLDAHEKDVLERVAAGCQRDVAVLDKRAKEIVDAEKSRHPFGRLRRGEALPPPPDELKALEVRRAETILRARDQLRAEMGENKFQRFQDFVRRDAAEKIKPVTNNPHGSSAPQDRARR
jgi:hypothetical protein